jgi:hypothetical protein
MPKRIAPNKKTVIIPFYGSVMPLLLKLKSQRINIVNPEGDID